MAKHILLVEDARDMQLIVRAALEDSYTLSFAESVAEAERFLTSATFDLILLDVVLPDGSGFELCQRLKGRGRLLNVPVIFLTGQTEVSSRVHGLEIGAEDYILKPFEPEELLARVDSHLRRSRAAAESTSLNLGGFQIEMASQKAVMAKDGQPPQDLNLTRIEFKLLVLFLRNPGKIFSRGDLLKQVWGEGTHVTEHTVDTHISSLRKKIAGSAAQLKSVAKQGYCVELPRG